MKPAVVEYLSLKAKAQQARSQALDADHTMTELLLILAAAYDAAAERLFGASRHIISLS